MADTSITYPSADYAVLSLERPESLNSLDASTLRSLADAAAELAARRLKVVVVKGSGRAFSAGADFDLLKGRDGDEAIDPVVAGELGRKMADAIEGIPAVTIAQLHGAVVGGGFVLAAACDLRIAADDTHFSIPEVDIGLPLGWGGIPRMVRELGPALTRELVMTCRPFTASEAMAAGFLNRSVPLADLDDSVTELVEALLSKPAYALLAVKRTVVEAAEQLIPALGRTADAELLAAASEDPESQAARARYLQTLRER